MEWQEWEDTFKPVWFDEHTMQHEELPPSNICYHYIWTVCEEDNTFYICKGFAIVNRLYYYVTELPWLDRVDYDISEKIIMFDNES
jgi:hypothetical protein